MRVSHSISALRTAGVVCVACALLAACSVLPKREAVQAWQPPEGTTKATHAAAEFSLRVDTPDVTNLLDQTAIVVMPAPGQISTYHGARWSEPPALLVRDRLVDAFMAAGLPQVTNGDDHFSSDYVLSGDLRTFQSEYRAGSPVVVVRLDARLRRGFSRTLLATRSFVVTQAPTGVDVPQIVTAFGVADDELARQVVAWTVEVANQDRASNPPATPPVRRSKSP